MCSKTLMMRNSATKIELNLTRKTRPITSPAKKGSENRVKTSALPARRVLDDGAVKAAFQAEPQPMARPAQAKLQTESQKEMNTVPKRLSGDCIAATPRTMATLKRTPGIR